MEFGANIGVNLFAIHLLLPKAEIKSVEINAAAAKTLKSYPWMASVVHLASFIDTTYENEADFAFTSGVLISHTRPDRLPKAYENLYRAARSYIMVCEYYSRTPVTLPYRGHQDRLFKRDFAGEMMDAYGRPQTHRLRFRLSSRSHAPDGRSDLVSDEKAAGVVTAGAR